MASSVFFVSVAIGSGRLSKREKVLNARLARVGAWIFKRFPESSRFRCTKY